jgi:hypothetical protein
MEATTESLSIINGHWKFITSDKGQLILVTNQYIYKCNKKIPNTKDWVCILKGCDVYVHTDINNNYLSGSESDHAHRVRVSFILNEHFIRINLPGFLTFSTRKYSEVSTSVFDIRTLYHSTSSTESYRRFVCQTCNTIVYDSTSPTARKLYPYKLNSSRQIYLSISVMRDRQIGFTCLSFDAFHNILQLTSYFLHRTSIESM